MGSRSLFSLFLQGVLCAQFAHYTSRNKRDSIWMKLFVAGLALMTTLKSLQLLVMTWIQIVATFGNLEAGSHLLLTHWLSKITQTLEAITTFYVQMFFSRRLWAISRNIYLVTICTILFSAALISCAVTTFYVFTASIESATGWSGAHLGIVLCGDLVLTGSTIFYLLRHSRACVLSHSPATSILNSLRRVTLQANFAADMRITTKIWEPGLVLVAFITGIVLPYLYAWSAMWTLNSREEICLAAANYPYTFDLGLSEGSSNSDTTQEIIGKTAESYPNFVSVFLRRCQDLVDLYCHDPEALLRIEALRDTHHQPTVWTFWQLREPHGSAANVGFCRVESFGQIVPSPSSRTECSAFGSFRMGVVGGTPIIWEGSWITTSWWSKMPEPDSRTKKSIDIMPSKLTSMEAYVLGGWGVLCAQFAHYTSRNKRDSRWMKLFVAGLALMTTLKSLQSLVMTWIQTAATFGNLQAGSHFLRTHWLAKITLILGAITAFYVQLFFCHRLWAISRNAYLVTVCIILFLAGLVSGAVTTFYVFAVSIESATGWTGAHLGIILCGDFILTGSTIFYLLRHSRTVLPYFYAWSAMWTLNSREDICLAAANCPYTFNLGISAGSSNSETTQGQHQGNPEPMVKVEQDQPDGIV
ncbi:hypothetical protein B0H14DRAFT_3129942 [Mycena olivaceomarginata]|nr:hypothetical protein B0H14DRAFT_3129942 [Mycena olivaceomarginata]